MDTTVRSQIPAAQMAVYRATARRRQQQQAHRLAQRRERAWQVAQQAAHILKGQFGARQVAVFGSVVSPGSFHQHSDVDLAVWGLEECMYYQAVGRLQSLDPDIVVDVVEMELAAPGLQAAIEHTGVAL